MRHMGRLLAALSLALLAYVVEPAASEAVSSESRRTNMHMAAPVRDDARPENLKVEYIHYLPRVRRRPQQSRFHYSSRGMVVVRLAQTTVDDARY